MPNLLEYHIPEAIHIRVTQCQEQLPSSLSPSSELLIEIGEDVANSSRKVATGNSSTRVCTFCCDPQLTTVSVLQSLVVRAFNLQSDFSMFYLDRLTNKSNLISKDIDLHQGFLTSSHPCLDISLYEIDYGGTSLAGDWQLSKNINKYRNILSDWDVVTNSDIILAQTINKTNNFIFKQLEKIKEKAILTKSNSWYLAETIYQFIIADEKGMEPIDDVTFRSFQDSEGRILSQRDLRIAVYRRGVEPSLRRVIWKHLLNVYPENYSGQERIDFIKLRCETYRQMRDLWQMYTNLDPEVMQLCNMVRKDVYRTDRHYPFYANCKADAEEDDNPNVTALFNILVTYALNHQYRYCQGMSDLASPLLYAMKDEAQAYITFCALMNRLGENFSLDGRAISRKFEHLSPLLKHYDAEFYRYLYDNGAHELLFCYRWILLDLKREFPFEEALEMLEVLWASIPPTNSAYQNLFDDGHLYKADSLVHMNTCTATKPEEAEERRKGLSASKFSKPANQRIRSIKFLPNVLSSDSQVLDSPTTSESDCEFADCLARENAIAATNTFTPPMPWDSPDLSKRQKRFNFEHPSIGSSKCDQFDTISSECYETAILNREGNEENEAIFSDYHQSNRNGSFSKSQGGDDMSTCSTFDSGIQRSNTLSSMIQVSDDSLQSINVNRIELTDGEQGKANEQATRRRQRFHCLNGLRNAHCNGDDLSDDEDCLEYEGNLVASYLDDPGYLTEFDCQASQLTGSVHSDSTVLLSGERRRSKPTMKALALAKTLLSVGKSCSVDSLTNSSWDTGPQDNLEVMPLTSGPQINVDAESPLSEFEVNCASQSFTKLMAKSVSEEVLNLEHSIAENMQTLSVGTNPDDANLDNLSSSSTSSLVILSKSTRSADKGNRNELDLSHPLLTPDELGPNDAFMLFLCLTIMLQNRDRIIETNMDRNDIQMFFDNMIRKHNVRNVLSDARHLFHAYLSQFHKSL